MNNGLIALLVLFALGTPRVAAAAADKPAPAMVASLASLARLEAGLEASASTLPKNNRLVAQVAKALKGWSGIEQLKGVDPKARWSVALFAAGGDLHAELAIPTTDPQMLLRSLAPLAKSTQLADGAATITLGNRIAGLGGRSFKVRVSESATYLRPADSPLGSQDWRPTWKMDEASIVSIRIWPDRLPRHGKLLTWLNKQRDRIARRRKGESDARYRLRKLLLTMPDSVVQSYLDDCVLVAIELRMDDKIPEVTADVDLTPRRGSEFAQWIEAVRAAKTSFGGLQGDVMGFRWSAPLPPAATNSAVGMIRAYRAAFDEILAKSKARYEPRERQVYAKLAGDLFDLMVRTAEQKSQDATVIVSNSRSPYFAAAAIRVADVDAARAVVSQLKKMAANEPRVTQLESKAEQLKGFEVDRLTLTMSRDRGWQDLLGGSPKIYVVTGRSAVWIAAGPDAWKKLRPALSGEDRAAPAFQATGRLGTIAGLVAPIVSDYEELSLGLVVLNFNFSKAGKVGLTGSATKGGFRIRAKADRDVVRMTAFLATMGLARLVKGR